MDKTGLLRVDNADAAGVEVVVEVIELIGVGMMVKLMSEFVGNDVK